MLQRQEIDTARFDRHRAQVPQEALNSYLGQHVAWDPEEMRIVASGASLNEVLQKLDEKEIDPLSTILDFIHDPKSSYLG